MSSSDHLGADVSVSHNQDSTIQNVGEASNAETMMSHDVVQDDLISQESSDHDVAAGVSIRSTSQEVAEAARRTFINPNVSHPSSRFASASTNPESLNGSEFIVNQPGHHSEDEGTETSGVALNTASTPPNPELSIEKLTAYIKTKYGRNALHQLVKHIVEHELSPTTDIESSNGQNATENTSIDQVRPTESKSKAISIRGVCRSSGWTRPPPSTPPEAIPHNLSMPTLPDLHPSTLPKVLDMYKAERAVDPEAFDKKTQEIREEMIRAKVARGGTRELLRNELTVELASRLDAAMVAKCYGVRSESNDD